MIKNSSASLSCVNGPHGEAGVRIRRRSRTDCNRLGLRRGWCRVRDGGRFVSGMVGEPQERGRDHKENAKDKNDLFQKFFVIQADTSVSCATNNALFQSRYGVVIFFVSDFRVL